MKKYLIYTDNHFCTTSSIVIGYGEKYSKRLENEIQGLNWAEALAEKEGCDGIICLGDFFDKPNLTDEEITALREIKWADLPHIFIVGNHESSKINLGYNSTKILENLGFQVIDKPVKLCNEADVEFCFLPYITESERQPLASYFGVNEKSKRIIFSHNDIKGIQYGMYTSVDGFSIEEIAQECNIFLNGHLHNGTRFSKNGLNLGNFTGQNFTEDAFNHEHCAVLLTIDETNKIDIEPIENPYAFNFYKFEINNKKDLELFNKLKTHAVISVKVNNKYADQVKEIIENNANIEQSRVTVYAEVVDAAQETIAELQGNDHLKQFGDYITREDVLGKDPIVLQELSEICK